MKTIFISLIIFILVSHSYAQDFRQTVRGMVIDKDSHAPIAFAAVQITNTNFINGTTSDEKGEFKFTDIPVGRLSLQANCMGYKSITYSNLELSTGNELVLKIEMIENVVKLEEVTVKASNQKENPLNTYAPISARTFSVEESQRYAGSGNDVQRMAMNFAGVSLSTETNNEIVIRGNSPVGVLFRLDGVDIPNPSHFGDGGTTGGPISMLNNNLLSNSDFLTGAFPAEYGNTISGVFDLRMKIGNCEQHEFLFQAGLMGIEAGAEGPISKKNGSSYLLNYRYSTLGLMRHMDIQVMGTAQMAYQDASFKFNFPTKYLGKISLFGFGGNSNMKMYDSERDTTQEKQHMAYETDYEMNFLYDNYSGTIGLVHTYNVNNTTYTKLILSANTIWNLVKQDSLSTLNRFPIQQYFSDFTRTKYATKFYLNKKFNAKNNLRTGISTELRMFSLLDSILLPDLNDYLTLRDYKGNVLYSQAFFQYQHKFSNTLHLNLGVNAMFQGTNSKYAIEPRAGLKWEFLQNQNFSLGYGLHSICTPVEILKQEVIQSDGTKTQPNTELGFTKSNHFVLAYDTKIFKKIRFKSELYYQYISDALVEINPSSYSFLNHGGYNTLEVNALKNGGAGYNYGLELTMEKFMHKGAYFLSTLSLFESKYRGSDGVLRNTAFNTNFVYNLLGGKEFRIRSHNTDAKYIKKIVLDGKVNWAGGQRFIPIDLEASKAAGISIFNESKAYSEQLQDYFRIDFRVAYKWESKRSTQELAIDIRNLTNRNNPFSIKYDPETGDIKSIGMGLTPDLLYRIRF